MACILMSAMPPGNQKNSKRKKISRFSLLDKKEQKEFIQALKDGKCEYKGIKLWGEVEFVDAFEDISIEYVDAFEDISVKFVDAFPDECGGWQKVDAFPNFTVKVVNSFADITVKEVDASPGMD